MTEKRKTIQQHDDFSNIDVTIFSRTSYPIFCFPQFFTIRTGGPLFGDKQNILHNEGKAKKFQHFRSQR